MAVTVPVVRRLPIEAIDMGASPPPMRAGLTSGAATAIAGAPTSQTAQSSGDGLGRVVLVGAHTSTLHVT